MTPQILFLVLALLLGILFCLTSVSAIFRLMQNRKSISLIQPQSRSFFYLLLHRLCFGGEIEELSFAASLAQNLVRFSYAVCTLLFVWHLEMTGLSPPLILLGCLFLVGFIVGEYLPRIFAYHYPERAFKVGAFLSSVMMTLVLPLTFLLFKLTSHFSKTIYLHPIHASGQEQRQTLIDLIEESDLSTHLDPHDRQLILSVMAFKDRIAREIMVPRVDIFSLPHDTTIEQAALALMEEGYSRTPVYKNTLDHIIGVLMYKDLLAKYMEYAKTGNQALLQAPISTLVKAVIYAPETKKISLLLLEFRKKQLHLAIIVDEYGGTEGLVSIENILEEIVGDISDEYDEEAALFTPLPHGGWIVDGRMSILDMEEQLGIEIPQEGDYDTIGGYLFHETGTIPAKGFTIHRPGFKLEVLSSDDRRVEKVAISQAEF